MGDAIDKEYTSNVAQTVSAASDFIHDNNPILICFIICVGVLCGLFYYQVTVDQQRSAAIVQAITTMDHNQNQAISELKSQMQSMNEHLYNIERQ